LRSRRSYKEERPRCPSALVPAFTLDGGDFFDAAFVASAGEFGGQPLVHDSEGFLVLQNARTEREHVGIVMLATHLSFVLRTDVGGPHAGHLVGGDGHANAAAADQDS